MTKTPEKRVRRTQSERSETTRQELVSATIRVIEERGLEGTSIYEIARAAGMTPGAIQHHYASKWALIREAAAHLIHSDDRYGAVEVWPAPNTPLEQRSREVIEAAWKAMYAASHYLTMWGIFLSCRTDPELLEFMAEEREKLRQRTLAGFLKAFPELGGDPGRNDLANMVFSTLRGMGMNELFKPPHSASLQQLDLLAEFVKLRCEAAVRTQRTSKNIEPAA